MEGEEERRRSVEEYSLREKVIMNIDALIYTIVHKVNIYRAIETPEDPWFPAEMYHQQGEPIIAPLFEKEFKHDYGALKEAIRIIVEEGIIMNLKVTDYPGSTRIVGLDVTHVIMSEYALELAEVSPWKIKLKSFLSGLRDKLDEHKEKVGARIEYYDQFSDDKLIGLAKKNAFSSMQDRIAVATILRDRGYGREA